MAERQALHPLRELRGKGLVHRFMHIEAVRRGAGLAHVAHLGNHRAFDRGVDIGVLEDNEGRIPAKLHHRPDDVVGGGVEQLPSHLGGTGEGDDPDAEIGEHGPDHRSRAPRGQDVDDTGRHSGLFENRCQCEGSERRLGGRLQDDGTAGGKRRADLAGRHGGGKVPWRHKDADAGRLVLDNDTGAGGRRHRYLADATHRLLRIPAKEFSRISHLAAGIRHRLAVLDRDQPGKTLALGHDQLKRLAQDFAPLARLAGSPLHRRAFCGIERGHGIVDGCAGDRRYRLFGRRIDHVHARAVRGGTPAAADIEVGRNVGEQVVVVRNSHGDLIFPTIHECDRLCGRRSA